ncbi:MAG: hypothetical protein NT123_24865, partial [Proteobacteria bacterium]|nr:hypothetical protein [Pseudomonadota bacterium]
LSTAPLAFRLKRAGGGTVDNRNQRQGLHLRNPKTRPNKLGHLSLNQAIAQRPSNHSDRDDFRASSTLDCQRCSQGIGFAKKH